MTGTRNADPKAMTLMDHIRELRNRLFIVAAVFIAGSTAAYVFRAQVLHILLEPLKGQKLVYLTVAGGFNFVFLISIYAGFAVAAPVIIQQIYAFVRPVLPEKIQKYSVRVFLSSLVLLSAGIVFGYFFAIPGALNFLYGFADNYVQASLTADSYLSFIISYTIGLGLVFQLPLVLLFIHWVQPLKPGGLLRSERWVIVLAFTAAAIITPTPDPINQTVMALPIIIIYQLGVIAVLISIRKERIRSKKSMSGKAQVPYYRQPVQLQQQLPQRQVLPLVATRAAIGASKQMPARSHRPSLDGIVTRPHAGSPASIRPTLSQQPASPASHSIAPVMAKTMPSHRTVDGILPRLSTT